MEPGRARAHVPAPPGRGARPRLGGQGQRDHRGALDGTTPVEILRAAMEAVALRFALVAEKLDEAFPERRGRQVVATGGGLLGSPTWTRIMADALGRTHNRLGGPGGLQPRRRPTRPRSARGTRDRGRRSPPRRNLRARPLAPRGLQRSPGPPARAVRNRGASGGKRQRAPGEDDSPEPAAGYRANTALV